jgi:hypothetical protein
VNALAAYDDGSGPQLYAAGEFSASAGGVPLGRIARWTGSVWSAVGGGIAGNFVECLYVFDDGLGPALYVGGGFASAGGVPANGIARWKGGSWSALGQGITAGFAVFSFATFDDGTGEALYVGGEFTSMSGVPAPGLARWRGCPSCYANCDGSTSSPMLNVNDFACFLNAFAAGSPSANCDQSTLAPVLNVNDFSCFLNRFAAGCP